MNIAIYRRSNKSRRIRVGVPVATALCVLGSAISAEPAYETSAEPVYELLDVATRFGSLNAREINEDGQAIWSGSLRQGFFWDGTALRQADTDESLLAGINDSGLVVGGIERGFIWDGIGELVPLGSVRQGIPFSTPVDINNRGQVVGAASSNFGDVLPFLWDDGTDASFRDSEAAGRAPVQSTNSDKSLAVPRRVVGLSTQFCGTTRLTISDPSAAAESPSWR